MDRKLELDEMDTPSISERRIKKQIYIEFLTEFKENLIDFVKESVNQVCISEIRITGTIKLFDGNSHGLARIKNQGHEVCYVSTNGKGGYQLAPTESIEFFVNNCVYATTVSGSTSIGFIRT